MSEWWPRAAPARLDAIRAAYRAGASIRYESDTPGLDFWQSAVETRRRQSGDCEDLTEVIARWLEERGLLETEAVRLAVVASKAGLELSRQDVDDWGRVWVPGVDHACLLWLVDVEPRLTDAAYLEAWTASRRWNLDAAWRRALEWEETGFILVWSWGMEGGRSVWRKHFERALA